MGRYCGGGRPDYESSSSVLVGRRIRNRHGGLGEIIDADGPKEVAISRSAQGNICWTNMPNTWCASALPWRRRGIEAPCASAWRVSVRLAETHTSK